jgi:hypothetical protein
MAMARAGLTRVVVTLTPRDIPDGTIDYYPETVIAEKADGTRACGLHDRLANTVWDAAVERFGEPDHPVLLTVPGSRIWLAELLECSCDPWRGAPCDACGGHGYIYRRKDTP